jgi:lysophospholipase L1-like esterase
VPGGYDSATKSHPYDDALVRIRAAMKAGVFKGIVWHQGESDSRPRRANNYLPKLQALIERLRKETGAPLLPFVAGELGTFRPNYALINTELQKLPSLVPKTALASSAGLEHKGDTTHFNAVAADELGKRMAEKMLMLRKTTK